MSLHLRLSRCWRRNGSPVLRHVDDLVYRTASHRRIRTFTTRITQFQADTGKMVQIYFSGEKKHPIATPDALRTLEALFQATVADSTVRAVFLCSSFTGADLHCMNGLAGSEQAREFIRVIDKLCSTIQNLQVPVVAVVDGPCLGAGMEVAASCDLRIATDRAMFGMPETKLGIPSVVQASLIPGLIGWGRARELLYFGDFIDAVKAHSWGFVNTVIPFSDKEKEVNEYAKRFDKTGPRALMAQKSLMRMWEELGTGRPGIEAGVEAFGRAFESNEASERLQQFLDNMTARKMQRDGSKGRV